MNKNDLNIEIYQKLVESIGFTIQNARHKAIQAVNNELLKANWEIGKHIVEFEQNGKEKVRSDFNLEPWKLSAIGELNLGAVRLYGSYALNNLHKNGLEQTPYNFGIRFSSW